MKDIIILISKKTNNKYYYKIGSGNYHCKEGTIEEKSIIDDSKNIVYSNINREFLKFPASNYDYSKKIKRGPQIIISKDLGYIIARTRVDKNSKIVEAGGGSGGATLFFSSIVKKVHTYEIVEENFKLIEKNLKERNVKNVKLTLGDITNYIEKEKNIDMLFLDLPEPIKILNMNLTGIKNGSFIVCYLPSISQIIELSEFVSKRDDLYLEEISEIILRNWKINSRIARPENRKDIDHTAFLVFIRKY